MNLHITHRSWTTKQSYTLMLFIFFSGLKPYVELCVIYLRENIEIILKQHIFKTKKNMMARNQYCFINFVSKQKLINSNLFHFFKAKEH